MSFRHSGGVAGAVLTLPGPVAACEGRGEGQT